MITVSTSIYNRVVAIRANNPNITFEELEAELDKPTPEAELKNAEREFVQKMASKLEKAMEVHFSRASYIDSMSAEKQKVIKDAFKKHQLFSLPAELAWKVLLAEAGSGAVLATITVSAEKMLSNNRMHYKTMAKTIREIEASGGSEESFFQDMEKGLKAACSADIVSKIAGMNKAKAEQTAKDAEVQVADNEPTVKAVEELIKTVQELDKAPEQETEQQLDKAPEQETVQEPSKSNKKAAQKL